MEDSDYNLSIIKINKKKLFLILFVIFSISFVITIGNEFLTVKGTTSADDQDKIFVMYAGSLVKI